MSCELLTEAWRRNLPLREKLVLLAMCDGDEDPDVVAAKCSLDFLEVIGAFKVLAGDLLVVWAAGRVFFRVGETFRDQMGRRLR